MLHQNPVQRPASLFLRYVLQHQIGENPTFTLDLFLQQLDAVLLGPGDRDGLGLGNRGSVFQELLSTSEGRPLPARPNSLQSSETGPDPANAL